MFIVYYAGIISGWVSGAFMARVISGEWLASDIVSGGVSGGFAAICLFCIVSAVTHR